MFTIKSALGKMSEISEFRFENTALKLSYLLFFLCIQYFFAAVLIRLGLITLQLYLLLQSISTTEYGENHQILSSPVKHQYPRSHKDQVFGNFSHNFRFPVTNIEACSNRICAVAFPNSSGVTKNTYIKYHPGVE